MIDEKEKLCAIALTQLKGVSLADLHRLCETVGSAAEVFEHRAHLLDVLPDASSRLLQALENVGDAWQRAEQEMKFMEGKAIQCIPFTDVSYPQRLWDCDDAPLVLFYCGNADLNHRRVISVVGTRQCTPYGRDVCHHFIEELQQADSEALVVSGLAYGIDICAHRESLACGLDTVAVLAHGLDRIYPSLHRDTAIKMTHQGGLLTEFLSGTEPEKRNFVQRNRIVAGLSDVTVVVESAERGGSLITASIADSYGRGVFAFPGRVYDEHSKGCNRLIYNEMAHAIRSVEDLFKIMEWKPREPKEPGKAVQQELFAKLTEDEQRLCDCLKEAEDLSVSQLVAATGFAYSRVSVALFELDFKGVVDNLGGTRYRLLRR